MQSEEDGTGVEVVGVRRIHCRGVGGSLEDEGRRRA